MKSLMWIYVMVGNLIRGMGETPIVPLGISYIEDFAKPENSPLYIGILEAGKIFGPFIGLLLASFCANIYVDIGSVNTDDLTITPTDTRWVGAWWLGFLICAGVNVLISIPFFFLPKTLPKEGLEGTADVTDSNKEEKHQGKAKKEKRGITKDFLPFMKSLFCNPIYMLFVLVSVLHMSSITIAFVFTPKYLEQQYGKSTAEIVFLMVSIPAPIYFGALIDRTCLHWGTLKCGKPGACRMYDINNFRNIFFGLPAALRGSSFLPAICILILLRKFQLPGKTESSRTEFEEMKLTEQERECMDVLRNPEFENDRELKTRL